MRPHKKTFKKLETEFLKNKIITTEDGSSSVFSEQFNCTYHSVHGAIRESDHIFIKCGIEYYLQKICKTNIRVLEFGFGTGLNALLCLSYSEDNKIKIDYTTIEAYPVSAEIVSKLNFLKNEDLTIFKNEFFAMHFNQDKDQILGNYFRFSKSITKFEDFSTPEKFDVIFFDAFGPDEQPHLWERPFLDKIPDFLFENGILVTYSVKGSFKRALKDLGFKVNKLQGPPGKREILRAENIYNN